MILTKKSIHLFAAVTMIMALATGCASTVPTIPPARKPLGGLLGEHDKGWWKVSFKIRWPEDTEPAWYMDVFVAHAIISPVLDQYSQELILWRFHRRAARDQSGHQFSFIFYCSVKTVDQVYHLIQNSSNLEAMKFAGEIVEDTYDDTSTTPKPNIQDTSDPTWSAPIKKSWPYFIMGVSQMWLNLIEEMAEKILEEETPKSIEEIEAFYNQINESIIELWQEEGRHALLHHLNAIFGYEPLAVYEKRFLKF